jgi:cytochrome c oxidase subunit II
MSLKTRLAQGTAAAVAMMAALAAQAYTETSGGYNLPTGATELAAEVYGLHMLIFYICCAIGVLVFGAMIYSIVKHRRSVHPKPADFHESTTVEIAWTVVPFIILIGMAIPAAGTLIKMEDTRNSEMTVKVTGYQWKWHYDYIGRDVQFFSTLSAASNQARQLNSGIDVNTVPNYLVDVDRELVLPVGKKIRFLITANDVIHAWWVAELAVKKDAIPGYINETWVKIDRPGVYRGVCAELCGRDHGFMPIVVRAVSPEEFEQWIAEQGGTQVAAAEPATATDAAPAAAAPAKVEVAAAPAPAAEAKPAAAAEMTPDQLMAAGKKVYETNCAACHQQNGEGMPPSFPTLKGSKVANGPAAEQIKQVLNGKGLMAPFKHLSDADLAAVVTYTRQSWGNQGGAVQPKDVAAAR